MATAMPITPAATAANGSARFMLHPRARLDPLSFNILAAQDVALALRHLGKRLVSLLRRHSASINRFSAPLSVEPLLPRPRRRAVFRHPRVAFRIPIAD